MSKTRIVVIGVIFTVLALVPFMTTSQYQIHLLIMTGVNVMLGLSFVLLYATGLISMAAAAFCGIGAYTSALLVTKAGMSFWFALPLSGLMAGLVALVAGSYVVRIPGIAFMVQTLVISMILPDVLGHFEFFGGWGGILGIPRPDAIGPLVFSSKTPFYYLVLILLLINMVAFRALYTSRIGRAWKAIKLNPQLAETLGVNLYWYRLLAFIISSVSAGIAGSFFAHYFQSLEPGMFTAFKSITVQIYGILGGLGYYILGPTVGSAIMTIAPEALRVGKEIEPIITGVVLLLLVIFLPGGILSSPHLFRGFASTNHRESGVEDKAGLTGKKEN